MKIIRILSILSLCFLSLVVHADGVSKFSFVTDVQSVPAGEISEAITIQAQTADGTSEPISETYDISFSSSSGTGEFLNSAGNPVSKTMSKNTSNRTFYYRDTTVGEETITIVATGRESGTTFSVAQHIYVGVPIPSSVTTQSDEDTSEEVTKKDTTSVTSSSNTGTFTVSFGKDRTVTVGSPVSFTASITKSDHTDPTHIEYSWSFGDGTIWSGKRVSHTYRYPGEYVVVLNAHSTESDATSRILITVTAPIINLERLSGGLSIKNKSNIEINLGGWTLSNKVSTFSFPPDTIIPSGKSILFSDEITGMRSDPITLSNVAGTVFATTSVPLHITPIASSTSADIVETLALQANAIQTMVSTLETGKTQVPQIEEEALPPSREENSLSHSDVATGTVTTVFEAPQHDGLLIQISKWPSRSFNFIKHLFVEE